MWSSFGSVLERAKEAAEKIESQIDHSLTEKAKAAVTAVGAAASGDDDDNATSGTPVEALDSASRHEDVIVEDMSADFDADSGWDHDDGLFSSASDIRVEDERRMDPTTEATEEDLPVAKSQLNVAEVVQKQAAAGSGTEDISSSFISHLDKEGRKKVETLVGMGFSSGMALEALRTTGKGESVSWDVECALEMLLSGQQQQDQKEHPPELEQEQEQEQVMEEEAVEEDVDLKKGGEKVYDRVETPMEREKVGCSEEQGGESVSLPNEAVASPDVRRVDISTESKVSQEDEDEDEDQDEDEDGCPNVDDCRPSSPSSDMSKRSPPTAVDVYSPPSLVESSAITNGFTNRKGTDGYVLLEEKVESLEVQYSQQQIMMNDLKAQLEARERQLTDKNIQLTSILENHETEVASLQAKIRETKEEAKRRILRAKERVEEMQSRLTDATKKQNAAAENSLTREAELSAELDKKEEIVKALRSEGEALMKKQSNMEQAVRSARLEVRELKETLENESNEKKKAEEKVTSLTTKLKETDDALSIAKRGADAASKLERDLLSSKEEVQAARATKLDLESQLKDLKRSLKEAREEVQLTKQGAMVESEKDAQKLRKERNEALEDMEQKMRKAEKEAHLREDALRDEVKEIRKRWQDAVRRADNLSMDIQESTAPLMRQLESAERQARVRASAWAEVENKLRSDLELTIVQNEQLSKERSDLKAQVSKLERAIGEKDNEADGLRETIDELNSKIQSLEGMIDEIEREREEWKHTEQLHSQDITKLKNDMIKSALDSEERYKSEIDELRLELQREKSKRVDLEEKGSSNLGDSALKDTSDKAGVNERFPAKRLGAKADQVDILQSTLLGLDGVEDGDVEDEREKHDDAAGIFMIPSERGGGTANNFGSFAAMEQLTQSLKASKSELSSLRKQLSNSEEERHNLQAQLGTLLHSAEKLPLYEARIIELERDLFEKELEIQGLQEDLMDVKQMYRQQLDLLLEKKVAFSDASTTYDTNVDDDAAL